MMPGRAEIYGHPNVLYVVVAEMDYRRFQRGQGWVVWPRGWTDWGERRLRSIRFLGWHSSIVARIWTFHYELEV